MLKTKIIIAGLGGVGGYFGGLLAKKYDTIAAIEICFFARGPHLHEIQKNGLTVRSGQNEFTCRPKIATDKPAELGLADLVMICTKSFDLETVVRQLKPCIHPHTIILPLLNGVDSKERIQTILPDHTILEGCVYIVSRLKQPGLVENDGHIQKLYFGTDDRQGHELEHYETLFKNAHIEATCSQNIAPIIWEKFIFISPIATATSYFDQSVGEMVASNHLETVTALINEVKQVAIAKKINISEDITEKTLTLLKSLPFDTTSSMHTDFIHKKTKTELESLTAYVIEQGEKYNIDTPTYIKTYNQLKRKVE